MAQTKTRHKEYSLFLALPALLVLLLFRDAEHLVVITLINALALSAIVYSAFSVVRHADVLAHRLGEPYGSLVLTLSVVVLEVSLISALMAAGDAGPTLMRDTLHSVIMIVMSGLIGISLLLGGRKFATQYFNLGSAKQYLTAIIPLSITVLVLPAAISDEGVFTFGQKIIVSFISAAMYVVFLIIQTRTHQSLFVYEHEDEDPIDHHGKPSAHGNAWHTGWLLAHLIFVVALTKLNASPLDHLLSSINAPTQMTGFLVALLVLSPEGLGAIKAVLHNQLQRAINLALGSVLATISLTVPTVTLIALLTGKNLIFGLSTPGIVVLLCALLLSQSSFSTGKTNALNGAAHLALFAAYLIVLML
ncbi:MAG: sodium-potassium/proton antiporter ChaA [Burkholderiales bacterium]|jgi:Ca2+:H+ antiporter|nr:sodium-potassium/proton antiporter ChaA [Burkholderiales bacterium]